MTEVINNYILTDKEERRKWKKPCIGETLSVQGDCNDGAITIKEATIIAENEVTSDGKVYLLEELQEDYKAFVEAINNNIPIIEYWNIKGNKREGYSISGFVGSLPIKKRIIRKDMNIVTLDDGKDYFVQWRNYSPEFNFRMFDVAVAADDIRFPESFDWFGGCRCRPCIIII